MQVFPFFILKFVVKSQDVQVLILVEHVLQLRSQVEQPTPIWVESFEHTHVPVVGFLT